MPLFWIFLHVQLNRTPALATSLYPSGGRACGWLGADPLRKGWLVLPRTCFKDATVYVERK